MTYTKEFEDWAASQAEGPPYIYANAHFWLSAFAQLVREEAAKHGRFHDVGLAFNAICERFKMEEK